MKDEAIIVMVSAPSHEAASQIASVLLDKKLAACVNILPGIHSLYIWEGQISEDEEVLMIIKSRTSLFEKELLPVIKGIHPYEVPEIISLPIVMGSPDYLNWLFQVTKKPE